MSTSSHVLVYENTSRKDFSSESMVVWITNQTKDGKRGRKPASKKPLGRCKFSYLVCSLVCSLVYVVETLARVSDSSLVTVSSFEVSAPCLLISSHLFWFFSDDIGVHVISPPAWHASRWARHASKWALTHNIHYIHNTTYNIHYIHTTTYTTHYIHNTRHTRMVCKQMSTQHTQQHITHTTQDTQGCNCQQTCCSWLYRACALQHTATHCNTLQHTAAHCNTQHHTATHCATLRHTATHYNTLQHTASHCNTLQHTASQFNALQHMLPTLPLQHTATHCNTLQHTAAHCKTMYCVCEYVYVCAFVYAYVTYIYFHEYICMYRYAYIPVQKCMNM